MLRNMELGDYGAITSVLISRSGETLIEKYAEGDATTVRNTRSCTKTVAGMLLGIAIERGLVSGAGVTLGDLLPESRSAIPAKAHVTLEALLTMSSCLECNDWDDTSPGNEELMYPNEDWAAFALDLPVRAETGFSYCTAGVVTLGIALERAVGQPLSVFARTELFDPLGIERAEWQQTPLGQTSTAGGLLLTTRALLTLGQLYLDGGRGIVAADWVAVSTQPHARIDAETQYGYLWWLRAFSGHHSYYMTGMGGNRVHVFPDLDLVVVITSANFGRSDAHDLSDRLVERMLAITVE
jgi:CubicO group peptidase (beta-lactamase class C family)